MADYLNDQHNFVADPKEALIAELRRQNEALVAEAVNDAQTIADLRGLRDSDAATIREFHTQVTAQRLRTEGTKKTVLGILRDMKEDGIDTDYLISIADALDIDTDTHIEKTITITATVEVEVGLFEDEVSEFDFDYRIFHKTDQVEVVDGNIELVD